MITPEELALHNGTLPVTPELLEEIEEWSRPPGLHPQGWLRLLVAEVRKLTTERDALQADLAEWIELGMLLSTNSAAPPGIRNRANALVRQSRERLRGGGAG